MPELLVEELKSFGLAATQCRRGASLPLNLENAYTVILRSQLASRCFWPLGDFEVDSEDELYEAAKSIPWPKKIKEGKTFTISSNIAPSSNIKDNRFASLRVKDAITDTFADAGKERPESMGREADFNLSINLSNNLAVFEIDLAGTGLHKRGYRAGGSQAPLRENLAAGLLAKVRWPELYKQGYSLLDPFCGSGTIAIEALFMAAEIAPGLFRDHPGFAGWVGHEFEIWDKLYKAAEAKKEACLENYPIFGCDPDGFSLSIAEEGLNNMGLLGKVHFRKSSIRDLVKPSGANPEKGIILSNPPYGERIGADQDLSPLYADLGDALKQEFQGWHLGLFTQKDELARATGLRAKKKHFFFNGPLECHLYRFDITPEQLIKPKAQFWLDHEPSEEAVAFANRLKKNIKKLKPWLKNNSQDCYRVYDKDLPQYAFAVDRYQDNLVVYEYEPPEEIEAEKTRQRRLDALSLLAPTLGIDAKKIFFKSRKKQRGKAQYEAGKTDYPLVVAENNLKFHVDLTTYLDTGLFLDHRDIRELIQDLAMDKSFLNLFCYTGSVTVAATKGGAKSSLSLDLSQTYLDWAEKNMILNGLSSDKHKFEQTDCLQWLEKGKGSYDLIFLDPPSFSNSKSMDTFLDIERDHVELIKNSTRLLAKDGILIFSTNKKSFKLDEGNLTNYEIENLTERTMPLDFQRPSVIHKVYKITNT